MDIDERTPIFSPDRKQEIEQSATIEEKRNSVVGNRRCPWVDRHIFPSGRALGHFQLPSYLGVLNDANRCTWDSHTFPYFTLSGM